MIAAVAWEIGNHAFLRTADFSERDSHEVMTKLTNEFIHARTAIYHGKPLTDPVKE